MCYDRERVKFFFCFEKNSNPEVAMTFLYEIVLLKNASTIYSSREQ